ncbi:MAG: sensor histidine kinase [Alphaproteobacteria bacterium]|nr:MAG: sensor histidine kinase [Alphaproteobacteria bacterium]
MESPSNQTVPSVAFRTVIITIACLWLTYFILATVRWEVLAIGFSSQMFKLRVISVLAGIPVTLVFWALLRLFDARPLWAKAVAALILALPISVLLAQINTYIFAEMDPIIEEYVYKNQPDSAVGLDTEAAPGQKDDWSDPTKNEGDLLGWDEQYSGIKRENEGPFGAYAALTELAFSRYFMMLAWASLYFALVAVSHVRVAERREQEFRNAAKAAELRSLRYQVNPHFLFNTLNSLSALVMTGKAERAERMIQTISRFYRHSLADEPTSDVRLDDEFDLQRLYLDIEAVRFPDRLRTDLDLPPELADARVPGMILQPLIENSVKYAVSPLNRPVTITVSAREEFDRLVITVSDDGPGAPEGNSPGFGIGLANVRDRLEARFGQDVVLTSGPEPGGYKSEIRIPLTRNG